MPNVSPFGFIRDQGKRALFPWSFPALFTWSLTKPKGEMLGVGNLWRWGGQLLKQRRENSQKETF